MEKMLDNVKELTSTVAHFLQIHIVITLDKLQDLHFMLKMMDGLVLFIHVTNISSIVIHINRHS